MHQGGTILIHNPTWLCLNLGLLTCRAEGNKHTYFYVLLSPQHSVTALQNTPLICRRCSETPWPTTTWEGRIDFILLFQVEIHHREKSRQELGAETMWGMMLAGLLSGLFPGSCSSSFLL